MKRCLALCVLAITLCSVTHAEYLWKNGTLIDMREVADLPMERHFELGIQAMKEKKWDEALRQFRIVTINFPDTDLAKEAYYFLGVAYFYTNDSDLANKKFDEYLASVKNPKYFIETFQYKHEIANNFAKGAKRHLFNQEKLPALFADEDFSLKIYDEIVAALPTHELAAKALFDKACFLADQNQFSPSITTLQSITKKFPRTELACRSYVKIEQVLLAQLNYEEQNPDVLPLAEITMKKFQTDFPKATEQLAQAKATLTAVNETVALGFHKTGEFYERKGYPDAALIYYKQVVQHFPKTKIAEKSKERLEAINNKGVSCDTASSPASSSS